MSDFNFENNDPTPVVADHDINVEATTAPVVEAEVIVEAPAVEPVVEAPAIVEALVENKAEEKPSSDKTAILYAMKDLKILGLGILQKGYNAVPAGKANKWLEKASVRLASAEEIKTYHNK